MNNNEKVIVKNLFRAPLATPTDLGIQATKTIAPMMNAILADVFVLYFLL